MNVQEVIHDALALAGVTADGLDAGDPDPQYQARALSCLRMLLGDWGTQLKLNNSQRTYVVSPQRLDMISVGLNDVPVQSTVELYTVPADGLLQLPVTNIAKPATPTIVVQNLATRIPYQVIVAGTPTAGQVLVNAITGLLTFDVADAGTEVTITYAYYQDVDRHVDIMDQPMDIEQLSFELASVVFPCTRISLAQYQQLSLKQQIQSIPQFFAWDQQYPIGRIHVWPQAQPAMTARVTMTRMILEPVMQGQIDLPEYYRKALTYNLATMLYTFYPTGGLDPEVVWHAKGALEGIKHMIRRAHNPKAVSGYRPGVANTSMFTSPGAPRIGG